jgi:prevent-host-death family protein
VTFTQLIEFRSIDQTNSYVSLVNMKIVNTYEAKSKLSELLRRARAGENIVIAQAGIPMVRLVPILETENTSRLGLDEGAFSVPDDFNDTLLDEY